MADRCHAWTSAARLPKEAESRLSQSRFPGNSVFSETFSYRVAVAIEHVFLILNIY